MNTFATLKTLNEKGFNDRNVTIKYDKDDNTIILLGVLPHLTQLVIDQRLVDKLQEIVDNTCYNMNEDWPYNNKVGSMPYNFRHQIHEWTEIHERVYWEQLGFVPPSRHTSNCFMVGEQYSNGCSAVFIKVENRFFGKICKENEFNPATYFSEVYQQFISEE